MMNETSHLVVVRRKHHSRLRQHVFFVSPGSLGKIIYGDWAVADMILPYPGGLDEKHIAAANAISNDVFFSSTSSEQNPSTCESSIFMTQRVSGYVSRGLDEARATDRHPKPARRILEYDFTRRGKSYVPAAHIPRHSSSKKFISSEQKDSVPFNHRKGRIL